MRFQYRKVVTIPEEIYFFFFLDKIKEPIYRETGYTNYQRTKYDN